MAQQDGPIAKNVTGGDLGNVMVEGNSVAGVVMQEFEKYGENNAYKDSRIHCLLQSCADALQKDNERPKAINKQIRAKCKSQNALVVVHKEALLPRVERQRYLSGRLKTSL